MQIPVKTTARLLNVSEKKIYRYIQKGTIPCIKVNDQYFFNRVELLEWATAEGLHISGDLFNDYPGDPASLPRISDALAAGGIHYQVGGADLPSVLQATVDLLQLPEGADRSFLCQMLLAREQMGSTGIGNGIAIPHVRNPVVLHNSKPSITVCFLRNAIDFHALDGKLVNVLFTIISPNVNTHLHLLSRLGYVLSNVLVREALSRHDAEASLVPLIAHIESEISISKV